MAKAYFCRPISFARKPNDWVKSKNRTKIFFQRMTRSSCTCVKLTCRQQRFNRLEYVLAIFFIKNTILTPHKMLKCFFFSILIYDLDFCNKLNKTIAVFYHVIMRLLCFVKGCLFEQRKNPTALLHVPDWPELSLVENRDCPHLGTGVQCCVRSDRFEKKY